MQSETTSALSGVVLTAALLGAAIGARGFATDDAILENLLLLPVLTLAGSVAAFGLLKGPTYAPELPAALLPLAWLLPVIALTAAALITHRSGGIATGRYLLILMAVQIGSEFGRRLGAHLSPQPRLQPVRATPRFPSRR